MLGANSQAGRSAQGKSVPSGSAIARQPLQRTTTDKAEPTNSARKTRLVNDDVSSFNWHLLPSVHVVCDNNIIFIRLVADAQTRDDDIAF